MPQAKPFTDNYLKSLKPESGRYERTAAGRPGLQVRVFPSGEKSFHVRYKFKGEPAKIVLGTYPVPVTLERAFKEHGEIREFIDKGIDPKEGRDAERRAFEAAKLRDAEALQVTPIRERYREWFERVISKERKRPEDVTNKLGANMLPAWGDRDPRTITKRDAGALFDSIIARDAPAMANDVCAQAKQFFKWLAVYDYIDANPVVQTDPGGEEYPRDRWLSDEELPVAIKAMHEPAHPMSLRVRLGQMLVCATLQRTHEVLNMMHDEIDRERMIWTIPGDMVERRRSEESGRKRNVKVWGKTKNGLEHVIPLTPLALSLIDAINADVIKQYGELQPYVLAGFKAERKSNHIEDKALARALRNCIEVDEDTNEETLFGLVPFTPHDWRRTGTTHLSSLGVAPHVKKRIINHTDTADVTEKVYDQWEYLEEKRAALTDWSRKMMRVIGVRSPREFVARIVDRARHVQKGIPKPRRIAA